LYQVENNRPLEEVDPSGLLVILPLLPLPTKPKGGLTIVFGALKPRPATLTDYVDNSMRECSSFDFLSSSALDFYNGIKRMREKCIAAQMKRGKTRKQAEAACLIGELIRDGHRTAMLGGGQTWDRLTPAQAADLIKWLGGLPTIMDFGCYACDPGVNNGIRLGFLQLLALNGGGSYVAYRGCVLGIYPKHRPKFPNLESRPTWVTIPAYASNAQLDAIFASLPPPPLDSRR
jgi:hypothetical protein